MRRGTSLLLALTCAAGTACGDPFELCDTAILPGLQVTVVDSLTEENLAPEATVVARDGEFAETLAPAGESYLGAEERPGTYTISAAHADYEEWTREGVRVEATSCGVRTRRVTAPLVPGD